MCMRRHLQMTHQSIQSESAVKYTFKKFKGCKLWQQPIETCLHLEIYSISRNINPQHLIKFVCFWKLKTMLSWKQALQFKFQENKIKQYMRRYFSTAAFNKSKIRSQLWWTNYEIHDSSVVEKWGGDPLFSFAISGWSRMSYRSP